MSIPSDLNSICYERNYLKEVIVRIDFVSPIPSIKQELPKSVSQAALKHHPIDEPQHKVAQKVKVSETELSSQKEDFIEWNFYGRNRGKRLVISPEAIFTSYTEYQKYEDLRDEYLAFVEVFFKNFDEAQPSRIGLRYINQIEIPEKNPLDWQEYISKDILGMFSYSIKEAAPTRLFHNYEVAFENFNLRFQFGMHNPDYPAPIRRKLFVLDYDAFFNGLFEPQEVPELLNEFHNVIQETFEQNITNSLRGLMNETK